jgi:hypothetical protein
MGGSKWRTAAAALALFAVNAWITLRLFRIDYLHEMGSIEAAYIALARYIRGHFPDLNWFPLWYGGIPYPDTYPPLLHFVVAGVAAVGHLPTGLAYHAVTATIYALVPVALFWAARRLGAGQAAAFAASLLYSLISPSCLLVREVRADSGGWLGPRRLVALVRYGEGPHLAALLMIPLALGMLHLALEKRRPVYYVGAGLSLAAAVLTNWIGAFAMALAAAAYLLAGFGKEWLPQWLRAGGVGCYAYLVAMPWATPGTVATIRANAPLVGGRFESNAAQRIYAAGFVAAMLGLAWLMRRWKVAPAARFGVLFFYGTAVISLGAYWWHTQLLPQSQRYHLEMDLAFWLGAALVLGAPAARLPSRIRVGACCALAAACVPIAWHQRNMAREMEKPIEIRSTVEYEISHWFGEHKPGRRVFAPGTIGFWMNAFSDTPLLTGGFDNGMRNTLLQDVIYQIYAGDQQQVALAWLKAFGCDAVVGGGPGSREVYHPYAHPGKFEGWPELWREGDDVIYAVPRHSDSLAHAVRRGDLVASVPPAYDPQALQPYLAALDDPALPTARFEWHGTAEASITGNLRPEHLLSVQVTWDEGWNARVNGQPRHTWGDKLGQMVVVPLCDGPCTVELTYDGGTEMRVARLGSGLSLAGGALWIVISQVLLWRKRPGSAKTN